MKHSIRKAGPAHAAALAAIHATAFPADESWDERIIAGQLGQPGVFALVDKRGGMLIARLAADEAEILTIAVAPQTRRRGVGRALMRAALAEASMRGAEKLFLEVSVRNRAALALYRDIGFIELGMRRGYYADGTDALILGKELAVSDAV
jgi:ribosomal-protein-alanine N-acetyltransferase